MGGHIDSLIIQSTIASFFSVLNSLQALTLGKVGEILEGIEGLSDDISTDIGSQIEDAIGGAFDLEGELGEQLGGALDGLVASAEHDLSGLIGDVTGLLEDEIGSSTGVITGVAEAVIGGIQDESTGAWDTLKNVGSALLENIGVNTDSAIDAVKSVSTRVLELIGVDTSKAIEAVRRVADSVDETTTGILSLVAENISETFGSIDTSIARETEAATSVLEASATAIEQRSEQQLEASEAQAAAIRDGIADSIGALTDASEGAISEVADAGTLQAAAAQEGAEATVQMAGMLGGIEASLGYVGRLFGNLTGGFIEEGESGFALDNLKDMLISGGTPEAQADELISELSRIQEGMPRALQFFINLLLLIAFQGRVYNEVSRIAFNPHAQRLARAIPSALPGIGEILELRNRDLLDDPLAVELLRLQGFSEQMADALVAVRTRIPEIGIVQSWYLREFVSEDAARAMLSHHGYDEGNTQRLIDMSFYIPPPQDIILWAVREVFNREQAERFGQFNEFPNEFAELASKQGISREFAQNYWAAHWRMPSPIRLFEMFHRKIIDRSTLELTLKAHDYTPFWREPMIALAYRPLTRVDIRRMHDLGLLTDAEVQSRYEDLGFSPDNAALMTEFTKAYNTEEAAESPEVIEKVARSATLGMFRDGVFTPAEATDMLIDLGMPRAEAEVFIEAERLDAERVDRKAQRDLVVEQAKAGALTFDEAFDNLGGLGLEPEELNRAITDIRRARAAATKLPTRDELDRMLQREIISDAEYVEALQRIGYAPQWAQRFLALTKENPL